MTTQTDNALYPLFPTEENVTFLPWDANGNEYTIGGQEYHIRRILYTYIGGETFFFKNQVTVQVSYTREGVFFQGINDLREQVNVALVSADADYPTARRTLRGALSAIGVRIFDEQERWVDDVLTTMAERIADAALAKLKDVPLTWED